MVAHELDRLGRSFADLAGFVEDLREQHIDIDLVNQPIGTVGEDDWMADITLGGLGFDEDDIDAKAADGYQILNVGTTTGAGINSLESWPGRFDD